MTRDLVIQDTCDVIIEDLVTGNVVGIGYAQIAGLEQTLTEDDLRGGIGNKLAYILRSSKDITLNVTSATFKPEFLALLSGEKIQEFTEQVTRMTYVTVKDNAGQKEIELPTELNTLTTIRVEDTDGKQYSLPVTAGVADASSLTAVAGAELEAFYLKDVTGRGTTFKTDKFPNKFKVTYQTITYDRELAIPRSDLYFVFDETIPSGAFNLSLQNGQAYIPELNFRVTPPKGSSVLGRTFEDRADYPEAP